MTDPTRKTAISDHLALARETPFGRTVDALMQGLLSSRVLAERVISERWAGEREASSDLPKSWAWMGTSDTRAPVLAVESALHLTYALAVTLHATNLGLLEEPKIPRGVSGWRNLWASWESSLSADAFAWGAHTWWMGRSVPVDFHDLRDSTADTVAHLREHWPLPTEHDAFTELYFAAFPDQMRKSLGEFYTAPEIVNYILDSIGYIPEQQSILKETLVDLSCGSGSFLVPALNRFITASGRRLEHCLVRCIRDKLISGCDINPFACGVARLRLLDALLPSVAGRRNAKSSELRGCLHDLPVELRNGLVGNSVSRQKRLFDDSATERRERMVDYVVGNPPYLRIQRISGDSSKRYYLENYRAATGRFDLYTLFIERGLRLLKPGGRLGYITSNKFMSTNAGIGIRRVISEDATIHQICDLSDTKVFSAAVLPCILILSRRASNGSATDFQYSIIREAKNAADSVPTIDDLFDYVKEYRNEEYCRSLLRLRSQDKVAYEFRSIRSVLPDDDGEFWHFLSPSEKQIIGKMLRIGQPLRDGGHKVSCGIKTTADGVFVSPMTNEFVELHGLEQSVVKPYLQGQNIHRWRTEWTGTREKNDTYVLYPHRLNHKQCVQAVPLDDIPSAAKYLYSHEKRLRARQYVAKSGREWYEIWVPQSPSLFEVPFKIVTPDFATGNTFALDDRQMYAGGSCFAVVPDLQEQEYCHYLIGIMNSPLMEFFHKVKASTFIYAGRYRYWTSYIGQYPIVDFQASSKSQVKKDIVECAASCIGSATSALEEELADLVYDLYGVTKRERRIVRELLQ